MYADLFGMSVALAGNRVLVGELWDDSLGLADAGAAHLFDADSGALLRSFTSPVPQASAQFGASVALTGTRAVVGTWQGTGQASAAYLFDSRLPPALRDDQLILPEDSPATAVNVLVNDFTVPGAGGLTVTTFTQPAHGTVTLTNGVLRYQPAPNYFGTDEFTYSATDATGASTTAVVRVSVTPVADAPVVQPATFAILEHSPYGTVVGTVTATDADGDPLRYRIAGGNVGAAFAIHPTTGRITVTNPGVLDYETTPTFVLTVEARDPGGLTGTAAITINLIDRPEGRAAVAIAPTEPELVVSTLRGSRVAVTVLSTADFNARTVNLASLRFGRTGEESSLSRFAGGRPRVRIADVNGDGRADLVAEFDVGRTGLVPGDTRAVLTGRLRDGTAFSFEYRVMVR